VDAFTVPTLLHKRDSSTLYLPNLHSSITPVLPLHLILDHTNLTTSIAQLN
jgi:hypothetical protein